MQDDCIALALGLPQLEILGQRELKERFEVTAIYRRNEVTSPVWQINQQGICQKLTAEARQTTEGKLVFLMLMKRRFRYLWRGSKVFTEPGKTFRLRRHCSCCIKEHLRRETLH